MWRFRPCPAYLDVISKVVPKIWARTNSAMMNDCRERREGRAEVLEGADVEQGEMMDRGRGGDRVS